MKLMKGTSLSLLKQPLKLSSFWVEIIFSLYLAIPLNITLWQYVLERVTITSFNIFIFVISAPLVISSLVFFILNLTLWPYFGKAILTTLILLSSLANFMMFQYGIFIDTDMIRNVFETHPGEALELISVKLIIWFTLTGIVPALFLIFTKIIYKPILKELRNRLIYIMLSLMLIFIIGMTNYKNYASFGRNYKPVTKLITPINYVYSIFRYFHGKFRIERQFTILDEHAKLAPYDDPYPTVFILIIGETARSMNFSLNGYLKETNPKLKQEKVLSFKEVYSCGTSTAISVPCMFSSNSRKNFDVDEEKMRENLLDLLKQGGYDIWWRENDGGCKGVCNRVNTENIDPKKYPLYCEDQTCFDEVLLEGLEEYLMSVTKDTFIILHMIGSHGPTYYKRYPDEFKIFSPTCDTADLQQCSKKQIENTYNNTIYYTDHVISKVIDILKKFPYFESGLMYISDHGESLGENNIYLHSMPYRIAPEEQIKVPMVLWLSDNMIKYDHLDYECINKRTSEVFSHDNVFHSLLGLMEVNTHHYDSSLDLFTPCRITPLPFNSLND